MGKSEEPVNTIRYWIFQALFGDFAIISPLSESSEDSCLKQLVFVKENKTSCTQIWYIYVQII